MNITQIKTFYYVATMGTFQRAAEKLNSSQPAVSARIVALENWFGVQLFDRSTHRANLTPQGRAFMDIARHAIKLEQHARIRMGCDGALHGDFRIGAADTLAHSWLPSFLTQLGRRHENARFEFQLGVSPRLRDDLLNQTLDFCFMVGPVIEPQIVGIPLCEAPVVMAASPTLGLHDRRLKLSDIAEHSILTFERRSQTYQCMVQACNEGGLIAKMAGSSSLSLAVALAVEGYGLVVMPRLAIRRELDNGRLVELDVDIPLDSPKFAISYVDGPMTFAARQVAAEAQEHLKSCALPEDVRLLY